MNSKMGNAGLQKWIYLIVPGLMLLLPSVSFAAGPVHGSRAAGMGTAFIAVADDPSAIIFNPAGLIKSKGTNIYAGATPLVISTTYKSTSGESKDTEFQVFFPPHLYISSDIGKKDIVVGVGVYSPFGIGGRKWGRTGLTRYISTESTTGTFTINPTMAWQASEKLSIGVGLNYMKAINKVESMTNQSAAGASDGKLSLEGDGYGFGYDMGVLYDLNEKISLGLGYRNRVAVDVKGTVTLSNIAPAMQPLFGGSQFETDTSSTLEFPDIWSFGVAYSSATHLTLAFDYELVRWSRSKEVVLDLETEVPAAGITDMTTVLDWKDSSQFKGGVEYRPNDQLSLRGGYAYIKSFVPDRTLSPANPDSDQHNFSIGFGYKFKKFMIDNFYNVGFLEERTVNNAILSGEYQNTIHYIGSSILYRFK